MSIRHDPLIPMVAVVTDVRTDTPDVKTFRVVGLDGKKPFAHIPGQCAMLSMPGIGEALFSITSSPTNEDFLEFSIKKCGCVTTWIHEIEPGQQVTLRGPYGNGFPVDTELRGKDLLIIAGGIGLAPVRSVINYVRANRQNYGTLDIVYGSRSKAPVGQDWLPVDGPEVVVGGVAQGQCQKLAAQGGVMPFGIQLICQRLYVAGQRSGFAPEGFGLIRRQLRDGDGGTVGVRVPVHGAALGIMLGFRQKSGMFRAEPLQQQGPQLRMAFHGKDALSGKGAQRAAL